jgi:hypothetical protein
MLKVPVRTWCRLDLSTRRRTRLDWRLKRDGHVGKEVVPCVVATRGGSSDATADGLLPLAEIVGPGTSDSQDSETDNGGAGRSIDFGRFFFRDPRPDGNLYRTVPLQPLRPAH